MPPLVAGIVGGIIIFVVAVLMKIHGIDPFLASFAGYAVGCLTILFSR